MSRTGVAGRSWAYIAERLLEVDPNVRDPGAEQLVLHLLSKGCLESVAVALGRDDPVWPLLVRLLVADADVRQQRCTPARLKDLFGCVEASSDSRRWHLWLSAIAAEYHLWRGEFTGIWVAQAALSAPSTTIDRFGLLGRARLRRVIALGALLAGGAAAREAEVVLDLALADLDAAEQPEEASVSRGLFAMIGIMSGQVIDGAVASLEETVQTLSELGSDRLELGWLGLGWTSASAGDFEKARYSLSRLQRHGVPSPLVFAEQLQHLLGFACDLIEHGTDSATIDQITDLILDLRKAGMAFPSVAAYFASLLLDAGAVESATRLLGPLNTSEFSSSVAARLTVEELNARIALQQDPSAATVKQIESLMDDWEGAGQPRRAADLGLRASVACRRLLLHDSALSLRARGLADLPADVTERTPWELRLADGLILEPVRDPRPYLRFLVPGAEVHRDGLVVKIPDMLTRILLELAQNRDPLTTEQLTERLWGGDDPEAGRKRLKAAMWRLRRTLGLGSDELVSRDSTGHRLKSEGTWRVDLWEFQDLATGTPSEMTRAIYYMDHDLCGTQFRYDDRVSELRHELHRKWVNSARRLMVTGHLTDHQLEARLAQLSRADPELVRALRDLFATGRS